MLSQERRMLSQEREMLSREISFDWPRGTLLCYARAPSARLREDEQRERRMETRSSGMLIDLIGTRSGDRAPCMGGSEMGSVPLRR
jgi:hypothetical protein